MDGKVVATLIFYACVVSCFPQDDVDFNFSRRKSTTVDPISDFFANPLECSNGKGVCIKECSDFSLMSPDVKCGTYLMCCLKEADNGDSGNNDNGFVFPTRPTRLPATRSPTTRPPTTRPPTTRPPTTKPPTTAPTRRIRTTPTTTTTTTEESAFDKDCGEGSSEEDSRGTTIQDSYTGEFPWNVGIFSREKNYFGYDQNIFHCGGTIIDDFVVMTAASCVHNKNRSSLIVIAGMRVVDDSEERRQERTLEQIIVHPKFVSTSQVYDIALLLMSDKVDYSRTINRVCLPPVGVDFRESRCLVTGWGGPSKEVRQAMKTVETQLTDFRNCQHSLQRTSYKGYFKLNESFQCADEDEGTVNLGDMDLGSPLVCTVPGKDKQFYQAGIFAWSKATPNIPSVFTNVTFLRPWIDEKMILLDRGVYIYEPVLEENEDD